MIFALHQTIYRRCLVFRSKMGAPHDNLKRSVPKQLCDGTQIHSGHSKSTGKGMAVAMPALGFELRPSSAVGNQPREPRRVSLPRSEGKTGWCRAPTILPLAVPELLGQPNPGESSEGPSPSICAFSSRSDPARARRRLRLRLRSSPNTSSVIK